MVNKHFIIMKNEEVVPGHRLMGIHAPEIAAQAVPGQFLHVRCRDGQDSMLRRPLSIHFVDKDKGFVYILYRIQGKGTTLLSGMNPGDSLDVIGPLGHGYTLPEAEERVAVVGGGIGTAPLFFLLEEIRKRTMGELDKVSVYFGVTTLSMLPGIDRVKAMGYPLHIATDDGTGDFKGTVIDLLMGSVGVSGVDRIYACGPMPMIKSLAGAVGPQVNAEVSVEALMGCGVGACLSCACSVKSGEGTRYAHACTDGPVFDLRELVL